MNELLTVGEPLAVYASQDVNQPLSAAHNFQKFSAGAELNVATGVTRLGHLVQYISKVANDAVGKFILDDLTQKQIGTTYLFQTKDAYTGFYFKQLVETGDPEIQYFRKDSAVNYLTDAEIDQIDFAGVRYLHVTGISVALSPRLQRIIMRLIERAHENKVTVIFDPNLRWQLWSSKDQMVTTVNLVAQVADIIIAGPDEGKQLTGLTRAPAIADFYFKQGRTQQVFLRSGQTGADYFNRTGARDHVAAFQVEQVIDTVGAGDGFAAGLIAGFLEQRSIHDCLLRANALGALAIQSAGDNDGYPTAEQLTQFLKLNGVLDPLN